MTKACNCMRSCSPRTVPQGYECGRSSLCLRLTTCHCMQVLKLLGTNASLPLFSQSCVRSTARRRVCFAPHLSCWQLELVSSLTTFGASPADTAALIAMVVDCGMVESCVSVIRANAANAKLVTVATNALLRLTTSSPYVDMVHTTAVCRVVLLSKHNSTWLPSQRLHSCRESRRNPPTHFRSPAACFDSQHGDHTRCPGGCAITQWSRGGRLMLVLLSLPRWDTEHTALLRCCASKVCLRLLHTLLGVCRTRPQA